MQRPRSNNDNDILLYNYPVDVSSVRLTAPVLGTDVYSDTASLARAVQRVTSDAPCQLKLR